MIEWLEKEIYGKKVFVSIITCVAIDFASSILIFILFERLNIKLPCTNKSIAITNLIFPFLFCSAFIEEMLFRGPISICRSLHVSTKATFIVAILLSIIFGYAHGGFYHIFMQGFGGFLYSILYIKTGGANGKYIKPLATTTTTHFAFNSLLTVIVIYLS